MTSILSNFFACLIIMLVAFSTSTYSAKRHSDPVMPGWIFTIALIKTIAITVTTNSVQTSHRQMVSLKCLNNFMLLEMDLRDIPSIKPTSLHLRHYSCKPHRVLNRVVLFRVPFQGCGTSSGTTRESGNSYITFSNVVENSLPFNKSVVTVSYESKFYYPFSCYYRQRYVINLQQGKENGTRGPGGAKPMQKGSSSQIEKLSSNGKAKSSTTISFILAETLLLLVI